MGQLSKATQQNASASEELAATAEELTGQAQQLAETISFFSAGAEDPAARRRRADPEAVGQDRRASNSPMRGRPVVAAGAVQRAVANGGRGQFRPY